jgi:hypothetical protein
MTFSAAAVSFIVMKPKPRERSDCRRGDQRQI